MTMHYKVLITCPQLQKSIELYRDRFAQNNIEIQLPHLVQQMTEDDLIATIGNYDGMIAGDDPLTASVLSHARRLKIISKWGVGVDNIDLEAAAYRNIPVTNTPGTFGAEVADVTIGYMILLARHLHKTHQLAATGEWPKIQGRSLGSKTLGIIGLGSIGQNVAKRALAMDMDVVGFDPSINARARAETLGAQSASFDDVVAAADFLALCCPLAKANRHLINESTLSRMKHGSYLINTARGGLVDENALVGALESGRIAGAALDVFETEPLPKCSSLRSFDNVILGAHNSSNTLEGTMRVNELAIQNLFDGLSTTTASSKL